jgi:hypothetical protein
MSASSRSKSSTVRAIAGFLDTFAERLAPVFVEDAGEFQQRPFAGQPKHDVGERFVVPLVGCESLVSFLGETDAL